MRRTARILSEFHPISKSAVRKWIKKFKERLPIVTERKPRKVIAIDETIVKANDNHYVYAAIERNEILMRVYPSRNYLTTRLFILEVLKYCENMPKFIIDKAPWLIKALQSFSLEYEHQSFR